MLTYNEKRIILDFEKENKFTESLYNFTFKPTIDRNSKRIAESKHTSFSYVKTMPMTTEYKHNSQHNSIIGEGNNLNLFNLESTLAYKRSGKSLI